VEPGDASAHLAWALMSYAFKNEQDAEMQFKMVISLDPRNPLAFHYLGMLLYQNQRWAEAEIILKMAVTNGLDDSTFRDHYLDSLNKFYPGNKIKDCVTGYLRHFAYSKFLDHYFLGRVYESWNHFAEAEQEYRQLINMNRKSPAGYIILWSLQKKTGHYKDAENTIKDFALVNPDAAVTELASFYQEMIRRNPAERDWYYTGGRFFYNLVIGKPDSYPQDKKEIRPDVDTASYVMLNKSLQSNTFDATPFESAPARKVGEAGFDTIFTLAEPTDFPRTKGIEFLKKADSLYQDDEEAIADINIRIGDLYAAQGIPQLAYPYYKKVIEFKPGDANSRMKLIESYASDYQLTNALEQLDSLNSRHEINFEKQLMLAECLVHAGRFAEAAALLKNATDLYPYKVPQIATLNGRLQFMSGNPAAAITYYKDYLGMIPNDSCSMYSLARCYALSNKNKEAMQWLSAAVKNGFNYSWVLKYDTAFDQLRKSNDWKTTFASVKPKTWVNTMTGQ
jgi:tetratricopeptide (TPR) repeat protein